jgi:hypothetical protein
MTKKLALLSGICALAMFLSTACSTTKSSAATNSSSNDAKIVQANQSQTLEPVAEPPNSTHRAWGGAISPYDN